MAGAIEKRRKGAKGLKPMYGISFHQNSGTKYYRSNKTCHCRISLIAGNLNKINELSNGTIIAHLGLGVIDMASTIRNKILVVDDDSSLRNLLNMILSKSGYDVDLAENGKLGLERLKKTSYDLVISDVNMPVMDGLSLYSKIKDDLPRLKNRFLFITADSTGDTLSFFTENACSYLPKPFKYMDLLGQVGAILGKGERGYAGKSYMS